MGAQNTFTVIYSFKVVNNKEAEFINCWAELTKLIYKYEGSYGSRLHKSDDNLFISYAQWPNKETFDHSGNKLPEKAIVLREKMRMYCIEIKTEYKLPVVIADLLNDVQCSNYKQPEN